MKDDNKVVVAMAEPLPGQPPTVILGIPKAAWEYMQDSKTHTFDLTKVGIPVQILMFGGADRADVMRLMDKASTMISGQPLANKPAPSASLPDVGIDKPTVN